MGVLARIPCLCFRYTLMLPSKQKYMQKLYVSYITASFTRTPLKKKKKERKKASTSGTLPTSRQQTRAGAWTYEHSP
jgi:hypothetical protein